jgi:AcrR family transcriptional regulator
VDVSSGKSDAGNGTRARTRRAILDAAVATLTRNPAASLADVAAAAGVGRTTVHRYFPERADLLAALATDARAQALAASERARLDDGPAPVALRRLCEELFELGDMLMLLFTDPDVLSKPEWSEEGADDRALLRTVERGHAEGTIDPQLPAAWVQQTLWAFLFAAWHHVGANGVSRHEALSLCLRSLEKALVP